MYGGAGSSKSYSSAQKIVSRIEAERNHRFLIVRKTNASIKESTSKVIEEVLNSSAIDYQFNKTFNSFSIPDYNSEIISFGLDDPDKLKSISGITGVWIEEADQLEEYDFDQLNLRLRGETKHYKQIILTWNPVDEDHWLKTKFFDSGLDNVFVLHSTYKNNEFIDDDYKSVLENQFRHNENLYRIYVLGEWGRARIGLEYYSKFNRTKHTTDNGHVNGFALHLTFDFNRLPYMTLQVWQLLPLEQGHELRCIKAYSNEPPFNTIEDTCSIFLMDWGHVLKYGLYIYGDTSGKNKQPTKRLGSYYDLIIESMDGFVSSSSMRILKSNPKHKLRTDEINRILNDDDLLKIRVNEQHAKDLILDMEKVKLDANGKKFKQTKVIDGVSREIVGHHSDAFDYVFYGLKKYVLSTTGNWNYSKHKID